MGTISLKQPELTDGVRELFQSSLVWDNHTCTTIHPNRAESLTYLRRHKAAGVDIVTLNVGFDAVPNENAIRLLADFRWWIRAHGSEFALIERASDIERARREGKLAVCFNLEGANCLYGQPSMVSLYYDLGVRWMLFAYNHTNALAGGCQDTDPGLTDLGRQVLTEMERVGMQVCCSHIGHQSAMEILARAKRPVIFSHANPRALWDHPRNIADEAIRACARTGGVIGINGIGIFLGNNDIRTETIVNHIDYVVQLVGPEHVGIGLDYAFDDEEVQTFVKAHPETWPPDRYPRGLLMMEPERLPEIAVRLLARGYRASDVRNIMGGNHLRLAEQVWK
jgi:membrane dipeptidase